MATTPKPEIVLTQGTLHNVILEVPVEIDLSIYEAKIQVRESEGSEVVLEFTTVDATNLTKSGQQLLLDIHAHLTEAICGTFKWQLMLFSNEDNAIKFPAYNFIIKPAITI